MQSGRRLEASKASSRLRKWRSSGGGQAASDCSEGEQQCTGVGYVSLIVTEYAQRGRRISCAEKEVGPNLEDKRVITCIGQINDPTFDCITTRTVIVIVIVLWKICIDWDEVYPSTLIEIGKKQRIYTIICSCSRQ